MTLSLLPMLLLSGCGQSRPGLDPATRGVAVTKRMNSVAPIHASLSKHFLLGPSWDGDGFDANPKFWI